MNTIKSHVLIFHAIFLIMLNAHEKVEAIDWPHLHPIPLEFSSYEKGEIKKQKIDEDLRQNNRSNELKTGKKENEGKNILTKILTNSSNLKENVSKMESKSFAPIPMDNSISKKKIETQSYSDDPIIVQKFTSKSMTNVTDEQDIMEARVKSAVFDIEKLLNEKNLTDSRNKSFIDEKKSTWIGKVRKRNLKENNISDNLFSKRFHQMNLNLSQSVHLEHDDIKEKRDGKLLDVAENRSGVGKYRNKINDLKLELLRKKVDDRDEENYNNHSKKFRIKRKSRYLSDLKKYYSDNKFPDDRSSYKPFSPKPSIAKLTTSKKPTLIPIGATDIPMKDEDEKWRKESIEDENSARRNNYTIDTTTTMKKKEKGEVTTEPLKSLISRIVAMHRNDENGLINIEDDPHFIGTEKESISKEAIDGLEKKNKRRIRDTYSKKINIKPTGDDVHKMDIHNNSQNEEEDDVVEEEKEFEEEQEKDSESYEEEEDENDDDEREEISEPPIITKIRRERNLRKAFRKKMERKHKERKPAEKLNPSLTPVKRVERQFVLPSQDEKSRRRHFISRRINPHLGNQKKHPFNRDKISHLKKRGFVSSENRNSVFTYCTWICFPQMSLDNSRYFTTKTDYQCRESCGGPDDIDTEDYEK